MNPSVQITKNDTQVSDDTPIHSGDTIEIKVEKDETWGASIIEILDSNKNRRFLSRRRGDHKFSTTIPNTTIFGMWLCKVEINNVDSDDTLELERSLTIRSSGTDTIEADSTEDTQITQQQESGDTKIDDQEIEDEDSETIEDEVEDIDDSDLSEHQDNESKEEESRKIDQDEDLFEDEQLDREIYEVEPDESDLDIDIEEIETVEDKHSSENHEDDEIVTSDTYSLDEDQRVEVHEAEDSEDVTDKIENDTETSYEEFEGVEGLEEHDEIDEILELQDDSSESEIMEKDAVEEEIVETEPLPVEMGELNFEEQLQELEKIQTLEELLLVFPIILDKDDRNDLEIPLAEIDEIAKDYQNELKAADLLFLYHIIETKPSTLQELSNAPVEQVIFWLERSYTILNNPQHGLRREYRRIRSEYLENQRQLETRMESARAQDPLSVLVGLNKKSIERLHEEGIETVGKLLQIPVTDLINLDVDPEKPLLPKLWIANAKSHVGIR